MNKKEFFKKLNESVLANPKDAEDIAEDKLWETTLMDGLEDDEFDCAIASEASLEKDWLKPKEDEAWGSLKNVTIKDLIKRVIFEDVYKELQTHYEKTNENSIKNVFEKLLTLEPKEPAEKYIVEINLVKEPTETYFDVHGLSPNDNHLYALELTPWSEWLNYEISDETLNTYSKEFIVAGCLFEMTFYGDTEDKIEKVVRKLKK